MNADSKVVWRVVVLLLVLPGFLDAADWGIYVPATGLVKIYKSQGPYVCSGIAGKFWSPIRLKFLNWEGHVEEIKDTNSGPAPFGDWAISLTQTNADGSPAEWSVDPWPPQMQPSPPLPRNTPKWHTLQLIDLEDNSVKHVRNPFVRP